MCYTVLPLLFTYVPRLSGFFATNVLIQSHLTCNPSHSFHFSSTFLLLKTFPTTCLQSFMHPVLPLPTLPILTLVLCNDVVRNHRVLKDTPRHVTRFIALGAVGNPDKNNRVRIMLWIHCFKKNGCIHEKKNNIKAYLVNHLMIICIFYFIICTRK